MWPDEVVEAAAGAVYASKRGPVEEWICDVLDAAFGVRDEAGVPVVLKPWLEQVGYFDVLVNGASEFVGWSGTVYPNKVSELMPAAFRVVSPEENRADTVQ